MLPQPDHADAITAKRSAGLLVSGLVTGEFRFPVLPVVFGYAPVLGARVPETTIHEHCEPEAGKVVIRFPCEIARPLDNAPPREKFLEHRVVWQNEEARLRTVREKSEGELVLIFDADCGFCSRFAGYVKRHGAAVAGGQSLAELGRYGLTLDDVLEAALWVTEEGRVERGPNAIAQSLEATNSRVLRVSGKIIAHPVVRPLSSRIYSLVAANRHKLPGGSKVCQARAGPTQSS